MPDATGKAVAGVPAGWEGPLSAVSREVFIPETIWVERGDEPGWRALSRVVEPARWRDIVHRDGYVVTQVDDGRTPVTEFGEYATSSASQPSLVSRMLEALDVRDGHRVLEIGTGTGYSAALLCARLGDDHVTTVERDSELAESARKSLARCGFHPVVVTGDGVAGYQENSPYDRIIATCSVRRVPPAWVQQTRPGGFVLTPFGNAYHNDALLRLSVHDDGTAAGRFVGAAAFMWLRDDRVLVGRLRDYVHEDDEPDQATTDLDPRAVFGGAADFAVGARVPDVSWHRFDADDESDEFTVWLFGLDGGRVGSGDGRRSWASVDFEGGTRHVVEQFGPRRLWDEVADAYHWWLAAGRPGAQRFGVTVDRHGQRLWLDTPDRRLPQLPSGPEPVPSAPAPAAGPAGSPDAAAARSSTSSTVSPSNPTL